MSHRHDGLATVGDSHHFRLLPDHSVVRLLTQNRVMNVCDLKQWTSLLSALTPTADHRPISTPL